MHAPLVYAALKNVGGWLAAFAHGAAPVAVTGLWQGAVIALVLGLCFRLTPRLNIAAAQRFALWAAAFAVVAILPFLPLLARGTALGSAANAPTNIQIGAPVGASAPAPWLRLPQLQIPQLQIPQLQIDDRWALAITALWLIAFLARATSLTVHSLRLRRLWSSATPIAADANLSDLIAVASPTRRPITLCTTTELDRPSVIGFFAPRILIPDWLFSRLTPAELEQVVLHEAEHLHRRDDWTNLLQKLALVLFPLNPALVWIESRLCREREMACDEGVVRRTQAPRAYAACLANLAERRLELRLERHRAHALSLGAFERRPELARRVLSLLARKQTLHPIAARALVSVAACGLLVASVELARCPQMVAFVPPAAAQNREAQIAPALVEGDGDRVFAQSVPAHGDSVFYVVETKAVLPADRSAAPLAPSSSRRALALKTKSEDTSERAVAFTDAAAPREVLLKAEMPVADSRSAGQLANIQVANSGSENQATSSGFIGQVAEAGFAGRAEVVVLTAWEEIETAPRNAKIVTDYDTGAAEQSQSTDAANRTDKRPAMRITFTRMIFLVAPRPNAATTSNDPAPGTNPSHAKDSGQAPAPSPESGWLVLQL
jgi:beta-lactamase regulating signal transducer with metallopeptidase domain